MRAHQAYRGIRAVLCVYAGEVYLYHCKMAPFEPGFPSRDHCPQKIQQLKMVQEKKVILVSFCNHTALRNIYIIIEPFVNLAACHSSLSS